MRWFKRNGGRAAPAAIGGALLGLIGGAVLFTHAAVAEVAPGVYLGDRELPGVKAAFGAEGRLIVPMRPFFEGLGAQVYWDNESRTARAFLRDHVVTLQAGNPTGFRDGSAVKLEVPAAVIDGRMWIPLRFAAESLGGDVTWDGEKQAAHITFGDRAIRVLAATVAEETPAIRQDTATAAPVIGYTEAELDLLRRLVNAEAFNQPFEGKVAVAAVVINRARQNGKTLDEIMHSRTKSGACHFTVVCNGQINRLPLQHDVGKAVEAALLGEDPTGGALFFNATKHAGGRFWDGLRQKGWTEIRIGNQSFFKP